MSEFYVLKDDVFRKENADLLFSYRDGFVPVNHGQVIVYQGVEYLIELIEWHHKDCSFSDISGRVNKRKIYLRRKFD